MQKTEAAHFGPVGPPSSPQVWSAFDAKLSWSAIVTVSQIRTYAASLATSLGAQVHGIEVLRVDTANYEGKKKRNLERGTWFRKPDYKKVYVTLGERWFPPERFCVPNK